MITKELIDKINELAKKKKDNTITKEELIVQKQLRQEYLRLFRNNMSSVMDKVQVVDEMQIEQSRVKPEVLEKLQSNDAIVQIQIVEMEYRIVFDTKKIDKKQILSLIT